MATGQPLLNLDALQGNLNKLNMVFEDFHEITKFILEIRKASIVFVAVGVIGFLVYIILKISRKNAESRSEKRYEKMMETLSRYNTQKSVLPYYTSCRQDIWHTQRGKRFSDTDGDGYLVPVHSPMESLEQLDPRIDDVREINESGTVKSLRH